ncbi:MAG: type IV pilus assembly protein PilM [Pirellulales bacterium]|nr:type IV pilus assembly protein PilM [Pirellulales bacterium]
MARNDAVWGIDVGQCALKALRCRPHDEKRRLVADAFDYIEYPKILSQAGADPHELIGEALKQFLSRNSIRGDRVAISVSGQAGLARFIKLPPVEAKKIPDIVRYEARQQIPFDLNDVIWDYQRMGGGSEEEGFALETEIGLFAMKRDAVFRTLEPFQKAGIEIDFVQLTPLALYNFMLFDQLTDLPPADEYDPESPPESIVVLSLGTDATDLVVTNGFRVWQRSVPIGGNHFTKALTKELKLTFAKAEHLKRNATAAQDPKAVFQAMRPVFSDLLTEVQRSIGYFTSLDRAAKIGRVVALGNAMKLPGLRRYLAQSLGFDIVRLEEFRALSGSEVLTAPAFKDNLLCFGVCYGLALQGLGKSGLRTNLLPKEIVQDRVVRQKKPWAVAAAATVLLGCGIGFAAQARSLSTVQEDLWKSAESLADNQAAAAAQLVSGTQEAQAKLAETRSIQQNLIGNVEDRILWLEMLKALNECLPRDLPGQDFEAAADIPKRNKLYITCIETRRLDDLSAWYESVKQYYEDLTEEEAKEEAVESAEADEPGAAPATPPAAPANAEPAEDPGPSDQGWLVVVDGYHYHNLQEQRPNIAGEYVNETLVKRLHNARVILPSADRKTMVPFSVRELGIKYATLVCQGRPVPEQVTDLKTQKPVRLERFDFTVHFCWQPLSPSERETIRAEDEEAKASGQP